MTDTPSSILLQRLQSTGSNTNLWGGYLNTNLQILEQASKGWQTLPVTGNATIAWTNYITGNIGQCAHLALTGSLTSPATLVFPSNMNRLTVHNNTGATVTIMCSGGVGVAIPTARKAAIFCNGTDYFTDTATWTGDTTVLSNNGDLVSYAQLQTAIAAASGIALTGFVLTSATAIQGQYLQTALTAQSSGSLSLSYSKVNAGTSSEQIAISGSVGQLGLNDGGLQSSSFSAVAGYFYTVPVGGTITLPSATASRGKIGLAIIGQGFTTLSGTVNGLSTFPVTGDQTIIICDADNTQGWI